MAMRVPQTDIEHIYTVEEFEKSPQFNSGYELLNGRLVEKPMPGDVHARVVDNAVFEIRKFDPKRLLGTAWSQATFDLGQGWLPMPDMGYLVASKVPIVSEKSIRGVPDLVMEVHSPRDLDTKPGREAALDKIRKYQVCGVKIIWAVNARLRSVEVYHPDQIGPVQTLGIDENLDGESVLPGFSLPVQTLFE